ncbi:MAG: FtsX-like permease family protein [Treponema sp.]|nr:FtsX-like permease family protein [Treponema sp.]
MRLKILKKDLRRGRVTAAALFAFMLLAALLTGSAVNIVGTLFSAIDDLFAAGKPPHFLQMHTGDIDEDELRRFAETNPLVSDWLISAAVVTDGSLLYWNGASESDTASVMENYFVTQNAGFDYLLDLHNEPVAVSPGEIAVPVYYLERQGLKTGDTLTIKNSAEELSFRITDFVRDPQMNPAIISSKRFVVDEDDLAALRAFAGQTEYSIEFLLTDTGRLPEFTAAYQNAGLPDTGPAIDINLLRLMNALTDGITAVIVFLVSLLLVGIAFLCLRFAILGALEEDYREIGVMKAIGIGEKDIRKIYMTKYTALAAAGCIPGCVFSFPVSTVFTANIMLYTGARQRSAALSLLPVLAAGLLFFITLLFCSLVFRKLRHISAVEALRAGQMGGAGNSAKRLPVSQSCLPVNIHLGLKDLRGRPKTYLILVFIFIITSFLIIVPVNLFTTFTSPSFSTYMGVGACDLRLDLRQSADVSARFERVWRYVQNDADIARFAAFVTCRYPAVLADGTTGGIYVETGDYAVFPLEYAEGRAPASGGEIALSSLNARSLEKGVNDRVTLISGGETLDMTVCGIYQDVTNGGRTAKALLPYEPENALWYTINADLKPGVDMAGKTAEYAARFDGVKVSHMTEYIHQTFGAAIEQIKRIVILTLILSLSIAVLMAAMFLKMMTTRDAANIRIMKSLGFTVRNIRTQYAARMLAALFIGITAGTLAANTLGQSLTGLFMAGIGVSKLRFIVSPPLTYLSCPLALTAAVTLTTLAGTRPIKTQNITKISME